MIARAFSEEVVGLVPARGGSKSVQDKNIAELGGWPLIRYVIEAGKAASSLGRIFCSTNDMRIAAAAEACGAIVVQRPDTLATDDSPVIDAVVHFLEALQAREGRFPLAVALLQPTSPFLLPSQIDEAVKALLADDHARSVQTVAKPPHNHHALNQREIVDGHVRFRFAAERKSAYNKQRKPELYIFGNLVVTRADALLDQREVFAEPSTALPIPAPHALDVDTADDFALAEWHLSRGTIVLTTR